MPGLYLTGQDSLFVGVVSALMSGVLTAVRRMLPSYHPLCTALMSGVLTAMRVSYLAGFTLTLTLGVLAHLTLPTLTNQVRVSYLAGLRFLLEIVLN